MLQVAHPGGTAQPLLTWCSQESTPLPNTLTGLGYSTLRFLVLPLPPQRLLQFPFPAPPPFFLSSLPVLALTQHLPLAQGAISSSGYCLFFFFFLILQHLLQGNKHTFAFQ